MENSMSPLTFIATLGKLDYTTTAQRAHCIAVAQPPFYETRLGTYGIIRTSRGDDPGEDGRITGELAVS